MANLQAIKRRIKSVQNTRQITKAMEMVAASKMRRAQEATLRSRLYAQRIAEINERLAGRVDVAKHELFAVRPAQKRLHVFFTSDQGLAGAYNANLTKELLNILEADKAAGVTPHIIVIGKKGAQLVSRLEDIELAGVYENWPTNPSVADVAPILQQARAGFVDGSYDEVTMVYTEFFSMIKQVVTTTRLLPLAQPVINEEEQAQTDTDKQGFEPSPEAVLAVIVPRLVEAQLIQAAYEASASEQSMRMVAMKNASDNASDLIDDFTLAYNGARQAGITQELAEISAGAEAIN